MLIRWTLLAIAAAAVVGAGAALVGHRTPAPGSETELARAGARPDVVGSASARTPAARRRSVAASASDPAAGGARSANAPAAPAGEPHAQLDEELRWTQEAIESSQGISESRVAPARARESRAGAGSGASALLPCTGTGRECRSSADCCPGLACAGGLAGYGTPGRCLEAR